MCFMVICFVDDIFMVCNIGMSWMIVFIIGVLMIGLFGLVYVIGNNNIIDFEMVFIYLL